MMPSPMMRPSGVVGTYCFALLMVKPCIELMAVSLRSFSASLPRRYRFTMWCLWSISTALCFQTHCSLRELWNSGATTG
jgi:hypothetical protein